MVNCPKHLLEYRRQVSSGSRNYRYNVTQLHYRPRQKRHWKNCPKHHGDFRCHCTSSSTSYRYNARLFGYFQLKRYQKNSYPKCRIQLVHLSHSIRFRCNADYTRHNPLCRHQMTSFPTHYKGLPLHCALWTKYCRCNEL